MCASYLHRRAEGLSILGSGAILTSLVLGAIVVFIVEKRLHTAAFALVGSGADLFGFMYGPAVGFGENGLGVSPMVTLGYLPVAGFLYGCAQRFTASWSARCRGRYHRLRWSTASKGFIMARPPEPRRRPDSNHPQRHGARPSMIRHIVLFSAKDPSELRFMRQALSRLQAIPQARHLEVAYNSKRDGLSSEIDLVVYGEFEDFEQLATYKAHPAYQAAIEAVRPRRELRIAVDYEVPVDPDD